MRLSVVVVAFTHAVEGQNAGAANAANASSAVFAKKTLPEQEVDDALRDDETRSSLGRGTSCVPLLACGFVASTVTHVRLGARNKWPGEMP